VSTLLAPGMVGIFHYTLQDDAGNVLDSSHGGAPMAYLHGYQNIVPGLESALLGKGAGDNVTAVVPPEDGYGAVSGPGAQAVHRREFPQGMELAVGRQLMAQDPDGQPMPLWITKIQGAQVWVDVNHPLAGKTLHFDVSVIEVRAASNEELAHKHVHGPGGHHH
jgi:FKBP-type peptidyl-prolyl cis-trans isomerase SlyD